MMLTLRKIGDVLATVLAANARLRRQRGQNADTARVEQPPRSVAHGAGPVAERQAHRRLVARGAAGGVVAADGPRGGKIVSGFGDIRHTATLPSCCPVRYSAG